MKRIILASILVLLSVSLLAVNALAKEAKNEKTETFKVSMDCQGCVNKIESNIPYEKGVKDLKVSLDNKECVVTYRTDKTTTEVLIKAFNKLGYEAEVKKDKTANEKEQKHNMTH